MLRAGWQVEIALTGRGRWWDRLGGLKYGIVEWTIIGAARHALAHTSSLSIYQDCNMSFSGLSVLV